MDKSILRKFAIESREILMTAVENQLKRYYVDEKFEKTQSGDLIILENNNITLQPLTFEEFNKRTTLISRIKDLSEDGSIESGKKRVIEETAYTWFNRIVAIRYMELNDMLPLTKDNQSLGIRVLSSINNEPHPEILKLGNLTNTGLDLKIDFDKYNKLTNENEQFNYVLKLICNKLGIIIPQVFDGITDYIDLLLPENLLSSNGFVTKIITEVSESNFKEGVEIIGWLYQYYNQTEKDRVMSSNGVYKKSEIPYVTQLFTPDWIVKYMVENSLGKYWIEHNGDKNLINNWKYFIKDNIDEQKERVKVTEIKFIDPCCGSGHILVYAFEVLYQIYREQGYNKNDIPELILSNNLFGLDIDDRAGQLSILSVILKAREYDQNIFNKNVVKKMNIYSIQGTDTINKTDLDILKADDEINEILEYIYNSFLNAKEIGSLLLLENKNYEKVIERINIINNMQLNVYDLEKMKTINGKFLPILKVAKLLSSKYEVIVTNPPYLTMGNMPNYCKKYVTKYYSDAKIDLCVCFMKIDLLSDDGYFGIINMHNWMFLQSFKEFRKYIIDGYKINTALHLGANAFGQGDIGTIVQTICLVYEKNIKSSDKTGKIIRLVDYNDSNIKEKEYLFNRIENEYELDLEKFNILPEYVFTYWLSEKYLHLFSCDKIKKFVVPKAGIVSGNDEYFIRYWYEIFANKINFKCKKYIYDKSIEWVPLNKGGNQRKYYGNYEYIIRLYDLWTEGKTNKSVRRGDINYYFNEGITWSLISGNKPSYRISNHKVFGVVSPAIFSQDVEKTKYILGFLNSKICNALNEGLNPTVSVLTDNIVNLPIIFKEIDKINSLVSNNIDIAKDDWDSFETSWDFKRHPLIPYGLSSEDGLYIEVSYKNWKEYCENKFNALKKNEEELNKLFIDIYGLQDELTSEVEDKDITVRKANKEREIKSLISYAVGCMFGRYSLDEEGLIFAGGTFDKTRYKTFDVDLDNVIPITEEKFFKDDIVERFINFIEIVYGKETLKENLNYIAETLGRKNNEDATDTIRRYFVNDFYKDHIKTYQKKPIYWMFESGKKNGFKCLIYMHRYDENLVAKIRLDYLYKTQRIYESRLQEIKIDLEDSNLSNYDVKKLEKEQEALQIKLEEIKKYNDKLSTIGDKRITIDLDDGVTENYKKFTYVDPITNKESSILAEEKTIIPKKK